MIASRPIHLPVVTESPARKASVTNVLEAWRLLACLPACLSIIAADRLTGDVDLLGLVAVERLAVGGFVDL
jgi:hypothetical protein